jgi:multidrug efflux pump subunit AcrA (membrane-fusion protein)
MPAGAVMLSPRKQQTSGVRTSRVEERSLARVVRTVGLLQADETKIRHIHTKISGWIEQLYVSFTGQLVERGQPVVSIYSPELVSTQVEYLLALKGQGWLKDSPYPEARSGADSLLKVTRQRLLFWDITPQQIRALEESGEPKRALILYSPIKGFVTIKEIYQGKYVTPEMDLYTITDLSQVWTYLDIYEYELPLVKVGQEVALTLAYFPGETFRGKVTYIYPTLDPQTRTNKIRVEFPNPGYKLKPDMYATAEIRVDLGKRLAVPEDAVLDSGTEKIVFQTAGDGHYEPRRVTVGAKAEGYYEVLEGLTAGAEVVTSANFLVDSESRLKAAMGAMAGHGGMQMGEKK